MRIKCEFCGATYDSNQHPTCPNCSAVTGANKVVSDQIKYENQAEQYSVYNRMERDRLNTEQEYLENQRLKNKIKNEQAHQAISKGVSIGCAIPVIIFVLLFVAAIIFGVYNGLKDEGFFDDTKDTTSEIVEVIETPQNVNLNETATLSTYSIICDRFEAIDPYPWKPDAGNEYIDAHFIIQNVSQKEIFFDEDIICIADGFQCRTPTSPTALKEKLRETYLKPELKTQGSICFQVPTNAKEVLIKIGDYITIKVR